MPAILPGLEVHKLGPIALPFANRQAQELKQHCQQAPHGKGTKTLVDTNVRRVWRMEPDRFELKNPDWEKFVNGVVDKVREDLGLEKQKLEAHLYDLLLYEPGSFFLPHKDGEKLDRMVATLVLVLPSSHEGGALVVRHEGQEVIIDFGGGSNSFQIHYAAFYADCEHEVRLLKKGYRLCLVYNLTLAKGKHGLTAPRSAEPIEEVAGLLSEWAKGPTGGKLVVTLGHQYTEKGLAWDILKGVDRAVANILDSAANRAGCKAYLALLTLWESGSAEGEDYGYSRRGRWSDEEEDEEEGDHEMGEIHDSSLSAKHWLDRDGKGLPMEELNVDEEELLDPESLRNIDPEEEFEGYTGNAGMTLQYWYRHAAIILWPESRHFDVLCKQSAVGALPLLKEMVADWKSASKKNATGLKAQCTALATAIVGHWTDNPHGYARSHKPNCDELFGLLAALDDRKLIKAYLSDLMIKDLSLDPGKALATLCDEHGWETFEQQLVAIFKNTTALAMPRNINLLETIASAKPDSAKEWSKLCAKLAQEVVAALERIDADTTSDWPMRQLDRKAILPGLIRALTASGQTALLSRVVNHTLARPDKYLLIEVQLATLTSLQNWLKKSVITPNPALSQWLAALRKQVEALTAQMPQKPTDFRRPAEVKCKCKFCGELNQYLANPAEKVHRFMSPQENRTHLEHAIRQYGCDVDTQTERTRPSHTLVCTKNTQSYETALSKYHADQKRLAVVVEIESAMPR